MTFAIAAVAAQLAWPLLHGQVQQLLAVAVVLLSAAAALRCAGGRNSLLLLGFCGLGAMAVEVWGVHTGTPFGRYAYTGHLGPRLGGVPLVVPMAWIAMAWPSLCIGRRLGTTATGRVVIAAAAMTAWDVMLDPQLVAAGCWRWAPESLSLQGVPLHNDLGWAVCSLLLMTVLDRLCHCSDDRVPIALWLWAWLGSVVADAVFLGLSQTAVVGGLTMGVLAVPMLARASPLPA